MVLVATGARPIHLKRTEAHHVDLKRRVWNIAAAKGGEAIELWLNDEMIAAWELFIATYAWGPWNDSHYARVLREAGWPAKIRPYNAKHSFGKDLGERGVDFQTIADWYGHTNPKTTRIYVPVLNSQLRRASELLSGRLGWVPESKEFEATKNSWTGDQMLAVGVGSITPEERNLRISKLLQELAELAKVGS